MKPLPIFLLLCACFLAFSMSIYLHGGSSGSEHQRLSAEGMAGKLVWQKYNCSACHQFYGLGGYLGPDLTNVYSNPSKGEAVIRSLVANGTRQMPAFSLTETEMNQLLTFLKEVDRSGISDPRKFRTTGTGMIVQEP